MAIIIPLLFLSIIIFALFKRVNVYKSFTAGVGEAKDFILSLLPYLATIFMMCALFEVSGISKFLSEFLSPAFSVLGIPKELSKLILIKPFSGSGSLSFLTEILQTYGADSYISRCACVLYGSSETVFYISCIYFAKVKVKGLFTTILIVLISYFISCIFACAICNIL